jgi:hypothetical protein
VSIIAELDLYRFDRTTQSQNPEAVSQAAAGEGRRSEEESDQRFGDQILLIQSVKQPRKKKKKEDYPP